MHPFSVHTDTESVTYFLHTHNFVSGYNISRTTTKKRIARIEKRDFYHWMIFEKIAHLRIFVHLVVKIALPFLRHVVPPLSKMPCRCEISLVARVYYLRDSRTKTLYRDLFENMMNIRAKSNHKIVARNVVSHSPILFYNIR